MDDEPNSFLRDLAALAGVALSPERETALAAGLEGTRRIAAALAAHEYAGAEPAGQFRAPNAHAR